CLENHTLILSESLLKEVSSNLHKKIKVPPSLLNEIIKSLHKEYIIPSYEMLDIKTCRDPNDVHVLSMAFAAGAQYIVSGDQDLLCLKQFRLIPILTPREFWNVLRLG
ncbi:MAG: putative toxin-antitoxin system toxin component, PIN family, partial [Candidatus Omnitrophica bacterium]|nr:putative toxin-antitoxin system toxin component, PIN family [Candidatus Omnitrophota bacterium]